MPISHSELKRLLHYNPETGVWTRLVSTGRQSPVGKPIRAYHRHGYVHFDVLKTRYLGHRLAWFYMTGEWPAGNIDHRDGNPANNSWNNLRIADQRQNNFNSKLCKRNKTGLKGVFWDKGRNLFCAQIKLKKSTFIGRYACPAAAHFAYLIAADKAAGEFARAR